MNSNKEVVPDVMDEQESALVQPEEEIPSAEQTVQSESSNQERIIEELQKKVQELEQRELLSVKKNLLQQNNLPADLADFIKEDADMENVVKLLSGIKQMDTYVPKDRSTNDPSIVSKEDFAKMSYTERLALAKEDPVLYDQLSR